MTKLNSTVPNVGRLPIAIKNAFNYKTLIRLTDAKTATLMSRSGTGCVHVTTHGISVLCTGPIVVTKKIRSLLAMVLVKAASAC